MVELGLTLLRLYAIENCMVESKEAFLTSEFQNNQPADKSMTGDMVSLLLEIELDFS